MQRAAQVPEQAGPEEIAKRKEDEEKREEKRDQILRQVLSQEARERLNRVAIVKPDRARAVEDLLIQTAMRGQIRETIDEERLKGLLEQVSGGATEAKQKISIQRKRIGDDDW